MQTRSTILAIMLLALCAMAGGNVAAMTEMPPRIATVAGENPIPREPGWKDVTYRGWEVLSIPGLILTYYDLDLDGALDYLVIRKILRKTAHEEITLNDAVDIARRDNLGVYISSPIIYFTEKYPLFYCLGLDHGRNCTSMWMDISEDGLNGNEIPYMPEATTPNDVR